MKELVVERLCNRDGLMRHFNSELEFFKDNGYSMSYKSINNYQAIIETVKDDNPSTEYMITIFKEKDGDMVTYSTNIKKL